MSDIEIPKSYFGTPVSNVSQLLQNIAKWHHDHNINSGSAHTQVWFRGHENNSDLLQPGVYRTEFTKEYKGTHIEQYRLDHERNMLSEFRTAGATFFDPNSVVDVYFIAQHFGMPTRLLDWTANPLAALYFAVCDLKKSGDADLFVMDAPKLLPDAPEPKPDKFPTSILGMRHPYVTDAIGQSFWLDQKQYRHPLILPVRPDNREGRISHQSSRFTLHMHGSQSCSNPTLARVKVEGNSKLHIVNELRQLNINEFTIYDDLDHLSKEIKRTEGLIS